MEEKQIEMKRAHRLTMEGRRCAAITGVSDVLSFDVGEVVLQTEDGLLMIKGEELHVSRLAPLPPEKRPFLTGFRSSWRLTA